jgi:hypothetical protein
MSSSTRTCVSVFDRGFRGGWRPKPIRGSAILVAVLGSALGLVIVTATSVGAVSNRPYSGATLQYGTLNSVVCTSSTFCVAVGSNVNSSDTQVALVEKWNGAKWVVQVTPHPVLPGANGSQLSGVACSSSAACTAVGSYVDSSGTQISFAERWNGMDWTVESVAAPVSGHSGYLNGVSCFSATNCVAVGASFPDDSDNSATLVEGWNGSSWSVQTTSASTDPLYGVSCASLTSCVAVGYGNLTEVWNGATWTERFAPYPAQDVLAGALNGVSCSSATSCIAVGVGYNMQDSAIALAERWNGTAWSIQKIPNPYGDTTLLGVSCGSATTCTATGVSGYYSAAEAWNGSTWKVQTIAGIPGGDLQDQLNGVSCNSSGRCTAVGTYYTQTAQSTLAELRVGTSWSLQQTP